MKIAKAQRAKLYAITALASAIWLVQSLMQAHDDGTLTHWSTIVFSICLLAVIGYTAYCAVTDWGATERTEDAESSEGAEGENAEHAEHKNQQNKD